MRWIEIIQLRSTGSAGLEALIEGLRRDLAAEPLEVVIYRHAAVPTDLSVHLVHETEGEAAPDPTLGQRLAATLGDHGMIDHSLWVEARPEPATSRRPS